MEKVLKFVLGVEREEEMRGREIMASGGGKGEEMESSESESDEEGEGVVETVLTKHLLQRTCGASFGPSGKSRSSSFFISVSVFASSSIRDREGRER